MHEGSTGRARAYVDVTLTAGYAVDGTGRELVLAEDRQLSPDRFTADNPDRPTRYEPGGPARRRGTRCSCGGSTLALAGTARPRSRAPRPRWRRRGRGRGGRVRAAGRLRRDQARPGT